MTSWQSVTIFHFICQGHCIVCQSLARVWRGFKPIPEHPNSRNQHSFFCGKLCWQHQLKSTKSSYLHQSTSLSNLICKVKTTARWLQSQRAMSGVSSTETTTVEAAGKWPVQFGGLMLTLENVLCCFFLCEARSCHSADTFFFSMI